MKRYIFTVKLMGRNGSQVHYVTAMHDAPDVAALADLLNAQEFIVVQQFKPTDDAPVDIGPAILNRRMIGKVREWHPRAPRNDE